jgi:cytochrome P450
MSEIAAIEPQLPEFFHPDILEDPAEWYGRAHAATPILRTEDGTHLVLSHALVTEAADRPEDFSSSFGALMSGQRQQDEEIQAISAQGWPVVDTMLTADDPVHARFRRLVNVAFASPRVNALESEIREIAASLLDAIAPNVPTDFMTAFAVPLPVTLIAEQIGLDRTAAPLVKRWSDASTTRHSGLISRERELECAHEMLAFQHFLKQKIDERRVSEDTRDLLGAVVNARVEGDRPLEDAEIMSVFQQLMVAGNETTTSTLAGGLLLLSRNPDQLAKVRANPPLIRPMIEEMLRLLSPTAGMWRFATRDTTLGGVPIAAGERVMLRFAAANRDPAVFADPDIFDIERRNANRHLAFGRGIHICIGNMLARKELSVAFEEILKRFNGIEIVQTSGQPRHNPHKLLHGLSNLEVVLRG